MKLTLLPLFFALSFHSTLLAQQTLHATLSADYDCIFSTVEQQFNKGRLKGDFRQQDTLLFEARRSVQLSKQGWTIGYDIQKTYDRGLFRQEKSGRTFVFPVDKKGKLKAGYSPPIKLNKTESRLSSYLRFTLLPFPPGELKEGVSWEATVNAIPLVFTIYQDLKEKLGRQCYWISFEQKGLRGRVGNHYFLEGEMFLEQKTGLLVWLDLKNGISPAYSQNRYRIQMALRDSAGLIATQLKEYAATEDAITRLKNNYEWIVPPVYNKVEATDQRGFIVQQEGRYGWLAGDGHTILPAAYDLIHSGAGQMMQVAKNDNITLVDTSGRILIDSLDENTFGQVLGHAAQAVKRKGKRLIINDKGKVLNDYQEGLFNWSPAQVSSKQNGLMIAAEPSSGKWGIIDMQGKWVVAPTYKRINSLDVDVFVAEGVQWRYDNPDLGMFRVNGDTVLPFGHKKIWRLGNNKYYIEHPSRTGIFDFSTTSFTPVPQGVSCIETRTFETEHMLVVTKEGKMGLLDSNLKTIIEIEFDKIGSVTKYGVVASLYGKMGVVKR